MLIGVVSDTHGYCDPQFANLFAGVDCILHAGDIGKPQVLDRLREIAPIYAVRGNIDSEPSLAALPGQLTLVLNGVEVVVVHRVQDGVPSDTTRIVVAGHSHRAVIQGTDDILYLNPGAAGRQGFHRERTAMLLRLGASLDATLIQLGPRSGPTRMNLDRAAAGGRRCA